MELKFSRAPSPPPRGWAPSSNRTFMELKSKSPAIPPVGNFCSNRTFMELKFVANISAIRGLYVLIVPLWN